MLMGTILLMSTSIIESFQPQSLSNHRTIQNRVNNNMMNMNNQKFSSTPEQLFRNTSLNMSSENETKPNNLPMLLDPGTKGGAIFLSLVLFIIPIIIYEVVTLGLGVDGIEAGKWIGVGFTFFTTVLWVATYILRVATKDMTYAKQLKDYENAVIAKRLEELDEDEIQALVEDIERDDF